MKIHMVCAIKGHACGVKPKTQLWPAETWCCVSRWARVTCKRCRASKPKKARGGGA